MQLKELGFNLLMWGFFVSFFGFTLGGAIGAQVGAILGVCVALIDTWALDCEPVVTA